MFSGIIEAMATVEAIEKEQENIHFTLTCPFASELRIDQSVAHNGVCLTVVKVDGAHYTVTAMHETLRCSNLGLLKPGDVVNVERSLQIGDRLDGHIVQGHVDTVARCENVQDAAGSKTFRFRYDGGGLASKGYFTVEKGSVTVNGVSLTVCNSEPDGFEVNIIPYTLEHTNFGILQEGDVVNLEFDILGKYIARLQQLQ